MKLPTRYLPERPDLDQLRRQAKELLDAFLRSEPEAVAEVNRFYSGADPGTFALHDAQLALARSYGYESWPKLKAYVEGITTTRLFEAVRSGDINEVRAILRVRPELASCAAPSSHGLTGLHVAVMARMPEMVRALMQAGADPRTRTAGIYALRNATSPLAIATERGYDEIAAIIREEETRRTGGEPTADQASAELFRMLNKRDEDSAIALLQQRPEFVRFQAPNERFTLLHLASARLLRRTAIWLLDHGADVNALSRDGSTLLDGAGLKSNPADRAEALTAMIALLRNRGAEITARSAVIAGDLDLVRKKAAEEDLLTPRDDRGWLLRLAAEHNQPEILKWLLEHGLDPDARTGVQEDDRVVPTWGMPLYHCTRNGKHAMAEILLTHGADPNAQVYASGTPLSEAYGQRDEK